MKHWIVIHGNPVDGYSYFGPFLGRDAAVDWGEKNCDGDWWISELLSSMGD